jgi:hypothetical protein
LSRQAVGTFGKRGKTHTQLEPFFLISRPDSWRVVAGAAIPRVLPLFEELNNDTTAGPITLAHTGQRQQQPDVIKSLKSHSHDASANLTWLFRDFIQVDSSYLPFASSYSMSLFRTYYLPF